MTQHDESQRKLQALLAQVSPEFTTLTADLSEVMKQSDNPMLVAALLYKLAQERQQTNELIAKMADKYDELSFQLKTSGMSTPTLPTPNPTSVGAHSMRLLPENDQQIMKLVETNHQVDASLVQQKLGYKNPNAASQRLNMLVKAGHLGKIQSGKKVVFVLTGH